MFPINGPCDLSHQSSSPTRQFFSKTVLTSIFLGTHLLHKYSPFSQTQVQKAVILGEPYWLYLIPFPKGNVLGPMNHYRLGDHVQVPGTEGAGTGPCRSDRRAASGRRTGKAESSGRAGARGAHPTPRPSAPETEAPRGPGRGATPSAAAGRSPPGRLLCPGLGLPAASSRPGAASG